MIIDAHSHFGNDFYCGHISLDEYIRTCNNIGVKTALLMPPPWPIYKDEDGEINISLLWSHDDDTKHYFSIKKGTDIKEKRNVPENPYKIVNKQYFEILSSKKSNISLNYVPLIHGVLDTPLYLEKIIKLYNPVALKVHGFGSGFRPDEFNPELIEVLKKYKIPLIIHTSVYNYNYGYGAETRKWRNDCHPLKWAMFLLNNNLSGILNHGACLNKDTFNLVNKTNNIKIGIGPDLDISRDFFKVDYDKDKYYKDTYLQVLHDCVDPNNLLFDLDYNWNKNEETGKQDLNQVKRISSVWKDNELDKIFEENAISVFKRLNKK